MVRASRHPTVAKLRCKRHIRKSKMRIWAVLITLLPSLAFAETISWERAIASVEASARNYRNYAVKTGGTSWAGTMYNGYQYDRHRCAILGRMLGLESVVQHIEVMDYPPLSSASDPHDLLVFSISLENWVAAARWAVSTDLDRKKNVWNLDCVGQMDIPTSMFQEGAQANANFEQIEAQLHVYGDIDFGFYERFVAALDSSVGVNEVTLGSGGGSVRDALLAGYEIRKRGLNTTIYGNCYSACPLLFVGGRDRVIWAAPYRLGFHQVYTKTGGPKALDDEIYSLIAIFLKEMGADPVTVIGWMLSAGPADMFEPPVDTLCQAGVATFVQRICNSSGKF